MPGWLDALLSIVQAVGPTAATIAQNPQQQPSEPINQEFGAIAHQRIGEETGQEAMMAQMQNIMAMQGMSGAMADSRMSSQVLDPYRLARGEIGREAEQRIKERSLIGLKDSYNQAINQSMQHANRMGVPLSSMQQGMQANLMQPALTNSMQMRAGMEQEELTRQTGMRDQIQQNMMAMQNMPALQRLLQIRMAETSRADFSSNREVGNMENWKWALQGGIDPETGYQTNWNKRNPTGIYPYPVWHNENGWSGEGGKYFDGRMPKLGPEGAPGARGFEDLPGAENPGMGAFALNGYGGAAQDNRNY